MTIVNRFSGKFAKQSRIAKSAVLDRACGLAVESLERRVLMSSANLATWDFGTLSSSTSNTTIETSPPQTSGVVTGTAYTVGMNSTSTQTVPAGAPAYTYPAANAAISTGDQSTYLIATGSADAGKNGGSEDGTTGQVWRVESGQSDTSPIGSQGVEFDVSTSGQPGTVSVQWDMNPSSGKAESDFIVEYTTNVTAASPTWTDVTQNLAFGSGNVADSGNSGHIATIGTSSTNDVQLFQNNNSSSTNYANLVQPGTNTITNGSSSYTIVSANGDYAQINGPLVGGSNTAWLNDLSVSLPAAAANASGFAFRIVNAGTGTGEGSVIAGTTAFKNWRFNKIQILATVVAPQQPIIETQPVSVTAEKGSTATFTAVAQTFDSTSASPPDANTTTVTWEVATPNGSGGFNTPQALSFDTLADDTTSSVSYNSANGYATSTLTVPVEDTKQGNEYLATFTAPDASSPNSMTTNGATLTVTDYATITSNPTSVTLPSGTENATFSASATGLSGLSVLWYAEAPGTTTYNPISNGGVYSGVTTNTLTLTDPTANLGGYTYEADYTDANGTVATTPALLTITRASLADWQFNSVVTPTPAQEAYEPGPYTGSGTLTPLGQANPYNNGTSSDDEDVTNSPTAVANDNFNEDTYRVRGLAGTGQLNNGWSNTAPEYSQGMELDVPVSGYDNFTASFDWYSTTQGVRDLQVQYYDPTTSAWVNYGSPYIASSNDFYGVTTNTVSGAASTGTPTPVFVDLRGVADLAGISTLQLRMVSAYDPSLGSIDDGDTYDLDSSGNQLIDHGQYASAAVYSVNQQQEFDFINASGSITLAYNGTTASTSYTYAHADAADFQTYLNSIPSITAAGGVTVLNNTAGYDVASNYVDDYTVVFKDTANVAEQPITIASGSGITGVPLPTSTTATAAAGVYTYASPDGVVQYNNTSGNWRFDNMIVTGDAVASAPAVTLQPLPQTFVPTTPAVQFTAASTSSTSASVQWYVSSPNTAGEYGPFAAYNAGTTNTTNTGSTYTSTLTISNPADSLNGDRFEAVFTNSTGSNTSNVTTLTEEKLANWTFPTLTSTAPSSPLPTINYLGAGNYELDNIGSGETSATLSTVGFNTPANGTTSGGPAADDIVTTAGLAVPGYAENTLRVRNSTGGWDMGAANDSEGVEIDFDATGYSNVSFTADWYASTQSIRDLQEEYNLNPGNLPPRLDPNSDAWVTLGSPVVATANDFDGASTLVSNQPLDINLSGIAGASNDPSIGIRLVSAYDPSASTAEYTAAASTASTIIPYNGTAGNWRFGDISVDAIPDWLAPATANNTTWSPSNNRLTADGAATINADPTTATTTDPTAYPALVDNTPGSVISVTPTSSPASVHVASIDLGNGSSLTMTPTDPTQAASGTHATGHGTDTNTLVVGTSGEVASTQFFIDPGSTGTAPATLDLADNSLVYHYVSDSGSPTLSSIQGLVSAAYNGGAWNGGTGITSSFLETRAGSGLTGGGLGIIDNGTLGWTSYGQDTLSDSNEILVSSLPTWLSVTNGSPVAWSDENLAVASTTAAITADPLATDGDEPNVIDNTAASVLTVAPTASGSAVNLAALTLGDGAELYFTPQESTSYPAPTTLWTTPNVLVVGANSTASPTFWISSASTIDLTNNDLLIGGTGDLSTVQSDILSGYAGDAETGTGIISSVAAGSSTYGVGYDTAADYTTANSGTTTFDGQTITSGETLVKYTFLGDATLSGTVGLADYNRVLANYNTGTTWAQGAFHPGNNTGLSDYNAVLANYNKGPTGIVLSDLAGSGIGGSLVTSSSQSAPSGGLKLVVNTRTGDVSLVATGSVALTSYDINDASRGLVDSGGTAGDANKMLLSESAGKGGNRTAHRSATNYKNWSTLWDKGRGLSEGQNSATLVNGKSSTYDTIFLTTGESINLGDIFNIHGGVRDLTLQFAVANAKTGAPLTGSVFSDAKVQYV
jgi:hypothetical protein